MWKTDQWFTSPWNFSEEIRKDSNFANRIQLHDVTLRDGEQQAGVVFTADDKVAIAEKLAELGVHRIEAGMPAVSDSDTKAIKEIVKRNLGPKIFGFARCMKSDVDRAADCGVEGIVIEIPASQEFIEKAYGWPLEKAIELSVESTLYAHEKGLYTVFFPINGTRADFDWFLELISVVAKSGHMDALGCVDTMGVLSPSSVSYAIKKMKQATGKPIEAHFHDDFGVGSANTILALAAGAEVAHTTISSLGERAGNASTEEVAMSLLTMYGVDLGLNYGKIYETSQFIRKVAGITDRPNRGITGDAISKVESGIVASWYKNVGATEPLLTMPYLYSMTGHPRAEIVLGKGSGLPSVEIALEQAGIAEPSDDIKREILEKVKSLSASKRALVSMDEFTDLAHTVIAQHS